MLQRNIKEHNLKWPHIPDHPYTILIIGGSGSGKNRKTIDDKISDENLQYNINREAAFSSGKIYKYEYLTRVEVLPKRRVIEQAKFTYSPLRKAWQEKLRINEK